MINSLRTKLSGALSGPLIPALILLLALLLAVQGQRLLYPPDSDGTGWLWFAAAMLLAAVAFSRGRSQGNKAVPSSRPAAFASPARAGLALLLILAGLILAVLTVHNLATVNNHQAMRWQWLASLGLLLAGSITLGALGMQNAEYRMQNAEYRRQNAESGVRVPQFPISNSQLTINHFLEFAAFFLLIALAVWLRVYRIEQMPPGIFVDETNAALDAIKLMEGRPDSIFGTGWFETPTLYAVYLVGLFKLLGTTFAALKAASLIPSILTVVALYPLARLMFGVPTAVAATFILATNRWHMTMSRWGWNEVAPLLFMIVALYFLLRALRDRRASDYALAGLFLGLGHYTYLASRLVTLVVIAYLLTRILFERAFLRRAWRGLILFTLVYLTTFVPLLVTYARNPFTFSNRSQQVSILHDMTEAYQAGEPAAPGWVAAAFDLAGLPRDISLRPLGENILRHLEMFHVRGDFNPRHNLPGEPMLDPITGALLLLILAFALWQIFRPNARSQLTIPNSPLTIPNSQLTINNFFLPSGHRYALLLLWLTIPLLGGILTRLGEAPQAYRTLPVVGAVALLAGDAAVRSARTLAAALNFDRPNLRTVAKAVPAGALAAVLLWAGLLNYQLFFNVQAKDGRVWQAFSPVETTVATEVAAKMEDHSLYLSPRLYYFSPLRYLTYRSHEDGGGGLDNPAYKLAEPVYDLPLNDPFGQDALFLLDTYYQDLPELFRDLYPGTTFEMVDGPGGQPLYLSVTVPGNEITALQGLQAEYTLAPDQDPAVRPYSGAPLFRWPPDLSGDAGLARWQGVLQLPVSGAYQFWLDGPGRLLLDDQPWTDRQFLGKGLHAFAIEQIATAPGVSAQLSLSWQPPAASEAEPVPPNFFFRMAAPVNGLRAEFFKGELWEGEPVFSRVDPLLLFAWPEQEPWPGPFSIRWTGTLMAPVEGAYRFQLHADDGVRIWLDGDLVGEGVNPDNVNFVETQVQLAAGPHAIRIDYFQRGGGKALEFWWQPPGDHLRPVPPAALWPY